jgi:multiple sugar transport system permease protein
MSSAQSAEPVITQAELDEHRRRRRLMESLEGYAFVAPAMLLIMLFGIFPVFFTVFVSTHRWRIRRGDFLGIENYTDALGTVLWLGAIVGVIVVMVLASRLIRSARERRASVRESAGTVDTIKLIAGWVLIAAGAGAIVLILPQIWANGDDDMMTSLRITVFYALGTVPIQLIFGMLLAVLLDQRFKGRQFFRVVFLLPYIVPTVASAAIFQVLFSLRPESFANELIGLFGFEPLGWLGERMGVFEMAFGWGSGEALGVVGQYWQGWAQGPSLALVSIMIFNYWVYIGYYALIYSNGLANIPRQLYEAAEVDGAKKSTVLFRIIIPLLSPSTFFLSLLGVIGTFKAFNSIYVLRNSATGGATDPMSVYIFFTFFRRSRFGYAAAMSLLLFLLVLGLTILQRRLMERRVQYGD